MVVLRVVSFYLFIDSLVHKSIKAFPLLFCVGLNFCLASFRHSGFNFVIIIFYIFSSSFLLCFCNCHIYHPILLYANYIAGTIYTITNILGTTLALLPINILGTIYYNIITRSRETARPGYMIEQRCRGL
nr:MAG TPA: hypothetical protein [Caudoviricetes sp.]